MQTHLIKHLKNFIHPPSPKITALQIEVSTCCQLSCRYCPRTILAKTWRNGIISVDLFKTRLAPHFDLFGMVFLQGWGEPLTHPDFWKMIAFAKQRGTKVGFLTNGLLFDRQAAELACDLGVDLVAFTFAGAVAETHERERSGSDFAKLVETVEIFADIKAKRSCSQPVISMSYTLMWNNLAELSAAVHLASQIGITQCVASHLDCIPSLYLEQNALFLSPLPNDSELIDSARKNATRLDVVFKSEPPCLTGEILVCEPNPLHVTLYVRANGAVVPCHQMALAPESVQRLYFHGKAYDYQPLVLGNIAEQSLPDILAEQVSRKIYQVFDDRAKCKLSVHHQLPDVPEFCKKCYKLFGV